MNDIEMTVQIIGRTEADLNEAAIRVCTDFYGPRTFIYGVSVAQGATVDVSSPARQEAIVTGYTATVKAKPMENL